MQESEDLRARLEQERVRAHDAVEKVEALSQERVSHAMPVTGGATS